jgi:threonine aldolase
MPEQSEGASQGTRVTEEERRAIFQRCERFLGGHGQQRPRNVLAQLVEVTDAEDDVDHYGAGKLIEDFESEIAGLLGKEAAVFMPSGTMAQQIALRIWSERKGTRTVAFHPTCHLELHEERGYQLLHGLHGRLVGNPHTLLTLEDLRGVKEPIAALLLELPQREIGGQLPTWQDLQVQAAWARERGVALHMDGARLWESGPFYDRPYAEIAAPFDSVYVSFYKGIGAIAGAALAGPEDFIAEARIWQRRHGGNLIHMYPYALAARQGLRHRLSRFPQYHARAMALAQMLGEIPGLALKPNPPHTNMMHLYLQGERDRLLEASLAIAREERVALFSWLVPTDLPGWWQWELSLGDAVDAFTDDEIAAHFRRVLAS